MRKSLFLFAFILLCQACLKDEIINHQTSDPGLISIETKSNFKFDYQNLIKDSLYWKNLSGEEKLRECQIPDSLLRYLTTENLAEICFNYPLYFEFAFSNNEEMEITRMINAYNGLAELSKREDGAYQLMKIYDKLEINNNKDNNAKFVNPLKLKYIELLLTNKLFINQIKESHQQELFHIFEKKLSEKNLNKKIYGSYSTEIIDKYIRKKSSLLVKNQGPFGENTFQSTTVLTPFGKNVLGYINQEFTPTEKYNVTQVVLDTYNVELIDSASRTYNCHSYAWNISNGGSVCWIDATIFSYNDNISNYLINDLYSTNEPNNSYGYRRIFYYNSAILSYGSPSNVYQSKWGSGPLVRHSPTNVPSSYNPNYRTIYFNPGIYGEQNISLGNNYNYTVYPNMSYATYDWFIDDSDGKCTIITQNGNTALISFERGGTFQIYCNIYNAFGVLAYTTFFEVLNADM